MFEAQNKSYFKIPGLQHSFGNYISHLALSCNHPRKTQVFFQNHFILGGGNSNIFYFRPENWGRWTPFWRTYLLKGLVKNHQTRFYTFLLKVVFHLILAVFRVVNSRRHRSDDLWPDITETLAEVVEKIFSHCPSIGTLDLVMLGDCCYGFGIVPWYSSSPWIHHHLSNEKNLRCLGYIWNHTTRLCGDYNKPLQGVPLNNQ